MPTRVPLPRGWGRAWLHGPGEHREPDGATVRAYDPAGRQLVWQPPAGSGRAACDLECTHLPRREMARLCGTTENDFGPSWVTTEVLAKLADVPILIFLKRHGLAPVNGTDSVLVREIAPATLAAFGTRRDAGSEPDCSPRRLGLDVDG